MGRVLVGPDGDREVDPRRGPASGRYVAPATPRAATGSGTTATPRPAATNVTSVEVSATSCRTLGSNPASRHSEVTSSVHDGAALPDVHDELLVAQVRHPEPVTSGQRMAPPAAPRSATRGAAS